MMKKIFILTLTVLSLNSFGQVNRDIWNNLDTVRANNYELQFPSNWRYLPGIGDNGPEHFFEASGIALQYMYNGAPVIVAIFVTKQEGKNLEECKNECIKGYHENDDREFPSKFNDEQEKIKLSSAQDAYFLHTHFYRKSKEFNESRFDLISYSDKAKIGYIYTVSVQYADDTYKFESEKNLAEFSKKLFSYFKII